MIIPSLKKDLGSIGNRHKNEFISPKQKLSLALLNS
jgi:hypothetical protein